MPGPATPHWVANSGRQVPDVAFLAAAQNAVKGVQWNKGAVMTHSQREIIFSEIDKALSDAPRNGTITFTLYFAEGDVTRMDCNKVKEIQLVSACTNSGLKT